MKTILASAVVLFSSLGFAGVKFSFPNEEITKMIDVYSKASGQKFVIDAVVRGKATITNADDVTVEEAFNLLSSALAANGFAISKQGDTMVVKSARNIQRDMVETVTALPALKPERMVTWVYTAKHIPVDVINRELRILSSKDGEMSVFPRTNQIFITDWVSNLYRVDQIFKQLDQPLDPKTTKMIEGFQKESAREAQKRASEPEQPMKRPGRQVKPNTPKSAAAASDGGETFGE